MSADTKSVDVLAVLDDAIADYCDRAFTDRGGVGQELIKARAAVSALIGVAQGGPRNGDDQERRQWLAELDAAIARVQGGVK